MQFKLPANLQSELVAYDPQLKALARAAKQSTAKKSKYPLGNPSGLIPEYIVSAEKLQKAVDQINTSLVSRRYQEFVKETPSGTVTHAVLYHYEQCWYAAWLAPVGKKDEYIYGYSYAYKDNATARKTVPYYIVDQIEKCTLQTVNRSTFITYTKLVTKQDVINGMTRYGWNLPSVRAYMKKTQYMYEPISRLETQIKNSIPQWLDSNSIFARIKTTCIADVLTCCICSLWDTYTKSEWLPSVELIDLIKTNSAHDLSKINISGSVGCLSQYKSIVHILDTPYFRKWVQEQCNESIKRFNDPTIETEKEIKQPWNKIFRLFKQIALIHSIWKDKCTLDHYQNNIDVLLSIRFISAYHLDKVEPWLNKHMPIASLFTMLNKFYEQKEVERLNNPGVVTYRWLEDKDIGMYTWGFRELEDTFSMLSKVLDNKELAPPKRWRITDFHDYVQTEAWKISNENVSLPQDLFPTPIKVQYNNQKWTFFQPVDTHQLGSWGQAVRNCVGHAANYAEGVRKKQHFIVLCMLDNKPTFTVQLKVSMGMMSVDQIAGISNARLTEDQRESYTSVFGQALQEREKMLVSA
jgi:hypothetical protein